MAVVHNRDRTGVINVFGPQNREKYNPTTVERVAHALETGGHTVRVVDGNMHVVDQLRDFMPRVISGDRPGMVFNMAYGIQGVSRYTHLPAMLEMLGVPYVGSNPLAHGLALDKVVAKIVFQNAGLPTPGFWNFATPDDQFDDLVFPVIVKPKMEAVSYGIRVVDNESDLRAAVADIVREFQQHVLVEQFIPGREFAVGLLGNADPEVLPIVEIDLGGDPNGIQTAREKLREPREKLCPAPLDDDQADELRALVKRAFQSLELFDFARVDVRMDAAGAFHLLEINSMASLGLTGTYVRAASVAGYSYADLINRMLDVAAVRYFGPDYSTPKEAKGTSDAKRPSLSARVRSYLRSQSSTIEQLLHKMVDMRTPMDDPERVNEFGEWLVTQFRQVGFQFETFPHSDGGSVIYGKNHSDEESDVLLLSHLDCVTPITGFVPFRADGNRLYGTGIAESKGGIAVALAALRALRFARAARKIRCAVLLTADATAHGARARPLVERLGAQARHVIGLQPADPDGGVVVSRAGRANYRFQAVPARSKRRATESDVFGILYRRLDAVKELERPDDGLRIGIRRVELDAPLDRFPDRAEGSLTVRFSRSEQATELDTAVQRVVKQRTTRGVRLRPIRRIRRPPMEPTDVGEALYRTVESVAARINVTIKPTHRWTSADICFVPASVPRLDGMGPAGTAERTVDEHVFRNSVIDHAAMLALVMHACAAKTK